MYSLVTLLTLLSFYFFLRLESRRSPIWIGYLLSSILLIYTHVFGLFIILAQNVYLTLSKLQSKNKPRLSLRQWLLAQGALGILYGPWVPVLNTQVSRVQQSYWIETPSLMDLVRSFWDYSGSAVSCLLLCVLSLLAVLRYKKKLPGHLDRQDLIGLLEKQRFPDCLVHIHQFSFLLIWLLTSTLLPFAISQVSRPIYISRVTIAGSLAFFLLAAIGVANIQGKYLKLAAVALVLLFGGANVREHYQTTTKIQWREITRYVEANAGELDLLVFFPSSYRIAFDYYSRRSNLQRVKLPKAEQLLTAINGKEKVWLFSYGDFDEGAADLPGYDLLEKKEYLALRLYRFRNESDKFQAGKEKSRVKLDPR